MALYLYTGTPGAGKTLAAINEVERRRKADNAQFLKDAIAENLFPEQAKQRQVFYHNININTAFLPWSKLEKPEDWLNCPAGSIILFDECQESFPPRPTGSKPPMYVSELAKSRHKGIDIYFVTQHPTFCDSYIRKLPEEHNHLMRSFGAKQATIHTFKGVRDNVDKTRKDSLKKLFVYPKESFNWYKSAEVHTHKFKMPAKVLAVYFIPVLLIAAIFFSWQSLKAKFFPEPKAAVSTAKNTDKNSSNAAAPTIEQASFNPADFKPRIDDVPWSAPRYDDLTAPTVAPRIVGCMIMRGTCKCMTQQGTYHHVTMQFCKVVVENGIFQDFDNQPASKSENKQENQAPKSQAAAPESKPIDSGFNLPVKPAPEKLASYQSAPSGNFYPQKIPAGGVMYRGQ